MQCGVRQGCPLSPLLFVIVAEVFGQAISKSPEIRGLQLPGGIEVKISLYADDYTIVTTSYGIVKLLMFLTSIAAHLGLVLTRQSQYGSGWGVGALALIRHVC